MTVDDLWRFQRVSDPQISPDGLRVIYVVTTSSVAENRLFSNLWLTSTAGKYPPRALSHARHRDRHPRWRPDGKAILFESDRSGEDQLWLIDPDGSEVRQLTTMATGAGSGIWSPNGKWIAFLSAVDPESSFKPWAESEAICKQRREEQAKNPVKARVFTRLFYRRWNKWVESKRQHLFVLPVPSVPDSTAQIAEPGDVTPGDRDAAPTSGQFSVGDDFSFTPDGSFLVFTAPPEENEAWSTSYNLCRAAVCGGAVECLTAANRAADGTPRFSPDGTRLAYRSQKRPGLEADKWDILVVDVLPDGAWRGVPVNLTSDIDLSVSEFGWKASEEGAGLYFAAQDKGQQRLFCQDSGKNFLPLESIEGGTVSGVTVSRDGGKLAYLHARMHQPADVFVLREKSGPLNVSHANDKVLADLDLPVPESVTLPGAGGAPMQMWILKPPGFEPEKKWPLAFLVHGGPQGAWKDDWSYRWNFELWAAQGYVVALPNPPGSMGFGQKYVDQISGDWGGKCFKDLMAGVAHLEKKPYIDPQRMGAAGSSFGGYMMNWFQGHTTKFKTLITHCGIYNLESFYGTTDELWGTEQDHGGTPWENPEAYARFSPHRFARNFKTPMLVIHNELDFRVAVGEGQQLFTALQRLQIPSKMISFPDEGHWVEKPANSAFWHREVFAWLAEYVPPGAEHQRGDH